MPVVLTEAEGRPAVNSSYFSSINPADGQCLLEKYSDRFSDCCFGLLGNLYACDGKPGKVNQPHLRVNDGPFLENNALSSFYFWQILTSLVIYELKHNHLWVNNLVELAVNEPSAPSHVRSKR